MSAVLELVRGIRSPWKRSGALLFMPSLRMDDSGDEGSTEVFVAAGYIAPVEAWDAFEIEWQRIGGGNVLHMSDLCGATGHGDFEKWSKQDRMALVNDMGRVIDKHLKQGIARAIFVDDYKDLLKPVSELFLKGTDVQQQLAAVAWTLRMSMEWVALVWQGLPIGQKVDLIFEEGTKGLAPAITYCRNLKRTKEWARFFGHIGTDSKENLISLQAGDFLAYHVFQFYKAQLHQTPYQPSESYRLATQQSIVNCGCLPRERIPDMLVDFNARELLLDPYPL
jgi:hypothetical protein